MTYWTVTGVWIDGEPVAVGAVEGGHLITFADDAADRVIRWSTMCPAPNAADAIEHAIATQQECQGDWDAAETHLATVSPSV